MRKPYFLKRRGQPNGGRWYVRHNGKQINLGPDKDEAFRQYHAMMAGTVEAPVNVTVDEIVTQFLDWTKHHRSNLTYEWYCQFLIGFVDIFGQMKVTDLKPYHVTRWMDCKSYEGTTGNRAVSTISRALNWAVKQGVLKDNPILGMERPAATPRECYIDPKQFEKVLAKSGSIREFLEFARATGARPQEIRAIERRHFDASLGAIVFPREESKGKRYQRIITLNGAALATVKRLIVKYPEGPIFRNADGKPWTRHAIGCAFKRLSKQTGVHIFAYSIRHSWATDALVAGVDPITVATLMGHKNLKMLMETYQKIQVRQDHIQDAVKRATGEVA